MEQILIIDDNEALCRTLSLLVHRMGMEAAYVTTISQGLNLLKNDSYDVVLLDVNLPDGSGLDIIETIRKMPFSPEIIIITGYGNENGAEIAIKNGVWDYIEKSTSLQNMRLSLSRAILYRKQKTKTPPAVAFKRDAIIGTSARMGACLNEAAQAANSESPLLLTGETGTGKELFAKAVHENSPQSAGAFVIVDCTALPEHLVESVIFGHQKGAFTGSTEKHVGLIEQADGGTLFLDEVAELPLEMQKKFLRVLQEKRFRPVGSEKEVSSNFRLICATHRNLDEMVAGRAFRKDLYYRIRALQITLPPLRDRSEDIGKLAMHRIGQVLKHGGGRPPGLHPDFIEMLTAYPWPGNVRELFNTIDWVLARSDKDSILFSSHLPAGIRTEVVKKRLAKSPAPLPEDPDKAGVAAALPMMKAYIEQMKKQYMEELVQQSGGDVSRACRMSGLSRAYLYQLLQKFEISIKTEMH